MREGPTSKGVVLVEEAKEGDRLGVGRELRDEVAAVDSFSCNDSLPESTKG